MSHTRGTITFEGGLSRPPRRTVGIVPQENVFFPEMTCIKTLRVWKAVSSAAAEDLEALLRDCDSGKKIHANAATLSGGQKRKLQLASGLLGESKFVLADECTSEVDQACAVEDAHVFQGRLDDHFHYSHLLADHTLSWLPQEISG